MIHFTIPQVYIKGRAKVGGNRVYTPTKTVKYEKLIRSICQDVMRRRGLKMIDAPLVATIDIRLVPPKSLSKKKRAALLSGDVAITGAFDTDNVAKAVLDAVNKVAFRDDRLVVVLHARKIAATWEGVDVWLEDYGEWRDRTRAGQEPGPLGPEAPSWYEAS